jgi:hypothetical protein
LGTFPGKACSGQFFWPYGSKKRRSL